MLGQSVAAPRAYAPEVLRAVPRTLGRDGLGIERGVALPFVGVDVWRAYELCWRNERGLPQLAVATLQVPVTSPHLVESKSLKLYLGGLYFCRFPSPEAVADLVARDVGACVGAAVSVTLEADAPAGALHVPPAGECVDDAPLSAAPGGRPDISHLAAGVRPFSAASTQRLYSRLLRSLCPVTGQPDWADVEVALHGVHLAPGALLAYVLGFAEHTGFHEQCVERIYLDLQRALRPEALSVFARYTRRGGIDINPFRSTPGLLRPELRRTFRQ